MAQALEEMRELQSAKGGADTSIGARPPTPLFLSTLSLSPSLSLSLLLSLSLPSPVSHTLFHLCLCLACCLPRAWQHACKKLGNKHARKPALGWLQSSKSPFKMHHPCLWRQLEPTVWGDNWSKQSGGKAMGSLSRILCHAFAEAQPLRCLCT